MELEFALHATYNGCRVDENKFNCYVTHDESFLFIHMSSSYQNKILMYHLIVASELCSCNCINSLKIIKLTNYDAVRMYPPRNALIIACTNVVIAFASLVVTIVTNRVRFTH